MEWIAGEVLKSLFGGQLAVFFNRYGEVQVCTLCMFDEYNRRLYVRPFGFCNYKSYFDAEAISDRTVTISVSNSFIASALP